jgi:hypothetical protein
VSGAAAGASAALLRNGHASINAMVVMATVLVTLLLLLMELWFRYNRLLSVIQFVCQIVEMLRFSIKSVPYQAF